MKFIYFSFETFNWWQKFYMKVNQSFLKVKFYYKKHLVTEQFLTTVI